MNNNTIDMLSAGRILHFGKLATQIIQKAEESKQIKLSTICTIRFMLRKVLHNAHKRLENTIHPQIRHNACHDKHIDQYWYCYSSPDHYNYDQNAIQVSSKLRKVAMGLSRQAYDYRVDHIRRDEHNVKKLNTEFNKLFTHKFVGENLAKTLNIYFINNIWYDPHYGHTNYGGHNLFTIEEQNNNMEMFRRLRDGFPIRELLKEIRRIHRNVKIGDEKINMTLDSNVSVEIGTILDCDRNTAIRFNYDSYTVMTIKNPPPLPNKADNVIRTASASEGKESAPKRKRETPTASASSKKKKEAPSKGKESATTVINNTTINNTFNFIGSINTKPTTNDTKPKGLIPKINRSKR